MKGKISSESEHKSRSEANDGYAKCLFFLQKYNVKFQSIVSNE